LGRNWGTIETALAVSKYFLMASPEAAASHWVQREVDWSLTNRSRNDILDSHDGRRHQMRSGQQWFRLVNYHSFAKETPRTNA
jgi:hypothetical protein